jgi:hypothetical protein
MAVYNYTTVITQVDASTINFAIPSVTPSVTNIVPVDSFFENMITGVTENMGGSFMTSPLPNSYDLDSTVAGMGSVFGDSVYELTGDFDAGLDSYTCTPQYFLVTTAIDAGIPLMPQTTGREIATYNAAVVIRQDIQDYFDAANYTDANIWIIYLTNLLAGLSGGGTFTSVVDTLPSDDTINVEIADTLNCFPDSFGYYNVITNTLTAVEYPYAWAFTPNSAVAQDNDVVNLVLYPDGVYSNYISVLTTFDDSGNYPALINDNTSYLLVTTTVDAQVTLYGAEHDPLNEAEAAAYAAMLALQTAIDVAYAANDYTEANALIVELQNLLAEGVSIELNAALSSVSDMVVSFDALPIGTYTGGTGTIGNTLTGVDFTFDGFPTSNLDLSTILNSETLGFGTDFPDGVYQLTVNFYVDGLLFTSMCYLVVTTDWQCCIDKAVGKKCGNLNTALMQSNLTNAVRIVDVYSDVNTANALIKEGNRLCGGCGCGCK